jgi:hypothetical protein
LEEPLTTCSRRRRHTLPGFAVVSRLQNNELIFSYTFYYSAAVPSQNSCNMLVMDTQRTTWLAKKVLWKKGVFLRRHTPTNAKTVVVRNSQLQKWAFQLVFS